MILAVTGHRPDKLGGYSPESQERLNQFALAMIPLACSGINSILGITGMAQGWDQACARAFLFWDIPFAAAIPFPVQETMWPEPARTAYRDLLSRAHYVKIVSQGGFSGTKMQLRNQWMVDQLLREEDRLLALWNGSNGGTLNCIAYAKPKLKPNQIINVWDKWESFR